MDRSTDPAALSARLARQPDRQAVCPSHGAYASRNLLRDVWSRCPDCAAAERERESAEQAERDRAAAQARHRGMLDAAAIPARFVGRTFDSYVAATDAQRHALTVARDYAESFDEQLRGGKGLIFAGLPGTGKSHLAAAILQTILDRDVRYLTAMDLIRGVRNTWRRDSEKSETQLMAYLRDLDLLAIDEVGVQYGTDGEQTVLFEVIDRRYRELRPTILLTNQSRDGFRGYVGDRGYDRLTETCRWVPFDWPSYRPIARREQS